MRLTLFDDQVASFAARTTPFLARRPIEHNLLATLLGRELRGRGYASAAVAAASRAALSANGGRCILYADRANPTSNAIYERIGYRRVGEATEYRFSWR